MSSRVAKWGQARRAWDGEDGEGGEERDVHGCCS